MRRKFGERGLSVPPPLIRGEGDGGAFERKEIMLVCFVLKSR